MKRVDDQVAGGGHEAVAPPSGVPCSGTDGSAGRTVGWFAGLVAFALSVRGWCLIGTAGVPSARHLIGDAAGYFEWARSIAAGAWVGDEAFYQAPLYPYVLAVLFKIAGTSATVVRWVQVLWGSLAVGCLYVGTRRWFGQRAGVVAGLMLALYPPAIFFDGIVQKASLGGVLLCALMAAMGRTAWRATRLTLVVTGLLLGLLVLTRENAIAWIPIVAVWAWGSGRGLGRNDEAAGQQRARGPVSGGLTGGVGRVLAFAAGLALVLGPVAVRNRAVGGAWSLSTFQAGPNFYIGNGRNATGRYEPLVRGHETPAFERRDATALAERETGRRLSPREVSRYWSSRAWREIRAAPARWLGLLAYKLDLTWNRYEVSDVESLYVYAEGSSWLRGLIAAWHFGVLAPLAVMGVALTWRHWRELWLLYALILAMTGSIVLFYVMARYRFPLVPLLIPFAAAGCVELQRRWRLRDVRALVVALVIGGAMALAVNRRIQPEDRLDALAWMNVGVSLAQVGELDEAIECFRRALESHPASAEAQANLAQALALTQRYAEAIPHYAAAQRLASTLPGLAYNLGVALEHVGRTDEARLQFERALAIDPGDADAAAAVRRLTEGGR